jgi:hypothetical protein
MQKTRGNIWLPESPVVYLGIIKMKNNMKDIINTFKWKWNEDKMDVIGGIAFFIGLGLFIWFSLWVLAVQ